MKTILALPWRKEKKGNIDLAKAEKILNEDHHGLEKVKERVLEYLAVIHLSKSLKGPILCLVGPPGVGKTTLARIIAGKTRSSFIDFSAVTSGIKEIKTVMEQAEKNRSMGIRTILFVDEITALTRPSRMLSFPMWKRGVSF
mgnify:CR=1 FL=1